MWTMLDGFKSLNSSEIDALIDAPVLIVILVGAADGKLDREERVWSEKLMQIHTYARSSMLIGYYEVVAEGFLKKVDQTLASLPADPERRNQLLAEKLSDLNAVLAKMDLKPAAALYKSFRRLAAETAKASGGFLRLGAVNAAEHRWLHLPMLVPVIDPDAQKTQEEEEEDWQEN